MTKTMPIRKRSKREPLSSPDVKGVHTPAELLEAFGRLSEALAREVELQKILEEMAVILGKAVNARYVNFWQLTPGKEAVYISAAYGMQEQYIENSRQRPILLGTAWIGRAVQSQKVWATRDILKEPWLLDELGPTWVESVKKQHYHGLLCSPLISHEGIVGGMCVYYPDVHEFTDFEMRLMRVAANQAATAIANAQYAGDLKAERNKTLAVFNSLNDGIIVFDLEGRIVSFNPRAEQLSWVSRETAVGKKPETLITEYEAGKITTTPRTALESIVAISSPDLPDLKTKEIDLREPQRLSLRVTALPLNDKEGQRTGSLRVFHDITEEKEMEALRTSLIAVASHQIRVPLASMKWAIDLLLAGDYGLLSSEQRKVIEHMMATNDNLVRLVDDILAASRFEAGKMDFSFQETDIRSLVEDTIKSLAQRIEASGVKFSVASPKVTFLQIHADPGKLRIAVTNLIDNALKYTPSGGSVSVNYGRLGAGAMISVTDTGIGIPEDEQKLLFTKFFRARNAIKLQPTGTGLGLWIANEIVQQHHGSIQISSRENKGTLASIWLPDTFTPQGPAKASAGT